MGDIFDEIAGNVNTRDIGGASSSGGDIFDQIAAEVSGGSTYEAPSFLSKVWGDIKETPSTLANTITSIPSGISNIYSSLFSPRESIESGTTEKTLRGVGSLAAGASGAMFGGSIGALGGPLAPITVPVGAAIGGGLGLLGFNKGNQLAGSDPVSSSEEDLDELRRNTVQGLLLTGAGKALGATTKAAASAIRPLSSELEMVQGLGINAADVKRAAKYKPSIDGEAPIERAVNGGIERGVFSGDPSPEAIKIRNNNALSILGDEVHGETGLLSKIDEVIARKGLQAPITTTKTADLPNWWPSLKEYIATKGALPPEASATLKPPLELTKTMEFIKGNPFQKAKLETQLGERIATINELWDGSLSSLSKIKSYIGNIAYEGLTDSKVLDQKLYQDLRNTIEERADDAIPGAGKRIAELNEKMSEHFTLKPIIEKARNREIAQSYKPEKSSGFLKSGLVGGVAGGATDLVAGAAGIPGLSTASSIALGATAGLAKRGLETPAGKALKGGAASSLNVIGDIFSSPLSSNAIVSSEDARTQKDKKGLAAISSLFSTPSTPRGASKMPNDTEKKPVALVEKEIDQDPYYSTLYEFESGRNPKAKNPASSAKGGFQFVNATAKSLGVKDAFDLDESFNAVKKLDADHQERFGDDPLLRYSAHYLGATVLAKVLKGKDLTEKEQAQVDYLKSVLLPRFERMYQKNLKKRTTGQIEV